MGFFMQGFNRVVITKQVTQQSAISTAERLGVEGYGIDRLPTAAKPDSSAPIWLLSVDAIPSNASILWASLGDACVDDNGCIDDDWLLFDSGTDRERIWAWFEREFNVSVAWLMGLAKSSRGATAEDHFYDQLKKIKRTLETFPGETYEGDITGHGPEWRAELVLEDVPSSESDDGSDGIVLVFALVSVGGQIRPSLHLEHHLAEVGVNDKHEFDLSNPATIGQRLEDVADEWEMDRASLTIAAPMVDAVQKILEGNLYS